MRGGEQIGTPNMEILTKDENKIVIDIPTAKLIAEKGGEFILDPKAEDSIIQLNLAIDFLTDFRESMKETLAEKLLEMDPNSKGIVGDKVRCVYRKFGSKYKYDWKKKATLEPFLDEKTRHYVNSEKVEAYLDDVGELPDGIELADRSNKLTITHKDE